MSAVTSRERGDDLLGKLLLGGTIIVGVTAIGLIAKESFERNRVRENCSEGILTTPCLSSVARMTADTATRAVPVATACFSTPVSPVGCLVASATAIGSSR